MRIRRMMPAFALLVCLPFLLAPGSRTGNPPAAEGPIVNRVLDLLNAQVTLRTEEGADTWQSVPFDTSQFTRAGVRLTAVTTQTGVGIGCTLAWQFSPDDAFQEGLPGSYSRVIYGDLGDDRTVLPLLLYPSGISEIQGTRARVVCRIVSIGFGQPGDPPSEPPVYEGTLSDVKVLLRRF